ncbi:hypothetical protein LPB19_03705 [Marinobacter salinisoli]|uniref:Thioredoxin-like fold domain-containing protein n=1 Tax=Marinobacter salinisoli TaxID=2769486 RepID=A0ABX7MT40_9GAMM|nr:hypothetical protein [Marinobacter salinisoli]QSP95532.1 hypothetical protein LPB19_03705 [Marinobacter salinisoli]
MLIKKLSSIGLLVLLLGFGSSAASVDPLPVPDHETFHSFLLDKWNPTQPTVVLMLDPFCPYCIRTLSQKERLSQYNVFLFWAPILGERSERRVAEILDCKVIAGPEVIFAVIERSSPSCDQATKGSNAALNWEFVNAYDPQAVPAYYFGGQRVSLSQLNRYVSSVKQIKGTVSLDWKRYRGLKVQQESNGLGQVAAILPEGFDDWSQLSDLVKKRGQFDWYIFPDKGDHQIEFCDLTASCDQSDISGRPLGRAELMLLFGLSDLTFPRFVLNNRLLSAEESERILGVNYSD